MSLTAPGKTVAICDTQPVTICGLRAVLAEQPDLNLIGEANSLTAAEELVRHYRPSLLLVDKGFGLQRVAEWISNLRNTHREVATVVWGISMTEAEALHAVQAGAHGVVRKTVHLSILLACLRTVAAGESWVEDVIRQPDERLSSHRAGLTQRERQVSELVEQGFRNKEIARTLGICPGTVKIHLRHIFEKTGVRCRFGLALAGLKEKGYLPMSPS